MLKNGLDYRLKRGKATFKHNTTSIDVQQTESLNSSLLVGNYIIYVMPCSLNKSRIPHYKRTTAFSFRFPELAILMYDARFDLAFLASSNVMFTTRTRVRIHSAPTGRWGDDGFFGTDMTLVVPEYISRKVSRRCIIGVSKHGSSEKKNYHPTLELVFWILRICRFLSFYVAPDSGGGSLEMCRSRIK